MWTKTNNNGRSKDSHWSSSKESQVFLCPMSIYRCKKRNIQCQYKATTLGSLKKQGSLKKTYWILENCSQSLFDPHDWEMDEWLIYPLFWIISHKRYRCKLNRDYWLFYIPNWQKQMLNKKCLKGCCLYISCMDCEWWLICGSDLPKHIRYDYSKIQIVNLEWNM